MSEVMEKGDVIVPGVPAPNGRWAWWVVVGVVMVCFGATVMPLLVRTKTVLPQGSNRGVRAAGLDTRKKHFHIRPQNTQVLDRALHEVQVCEPVAVNGNGSALIYNRIAKVGLDLPPPFLFCFSLAHGTVM